MKRTIKGYSRKKDSEIFKVKHLFRAKILANICTLTGRKDCDKLGRCQLMFPFLNPRDINSDYLALKLRKPVSKLTIKDLHEKPLQISKRAYKKCRRVKIVLEVTTTEG